MSHSDRHDDVNRSQLASRPTMQLVTDIYNGPGPASTQESADAWRALSAGLTAADAEFTSAMKLAMGS